MPCILYFGGFRIVIYPNDHLPPHVHVMGTNWEIKLSLGSPPQLLGVKGSPTKGDLRKALTVVSEQTDELMNAWRNIHG